MGREPNSHTPLGKLDLLAIQAEMRQKTVEQLCREYESILELAKLYGRQPCKPWVIQTLVQVWRELNRRTAKVGLIEIALGTLDLLLDTKLFPLSWHINDSSRHTGLSAIFGGLELLFLAPIVSLTFASSVIFLRARIDRLFLIMSDKQRKGHDMEGDHAGIVHDEMHSVKISVTGLMISVLLTDLVGRVISSSELTFSNVVGSVLATVLCLAYYIVLTHKGESPSGQVV